MPGGGKEEETAADEWSGEDEDDVLTWHNQIKQANHWLQLSHIDRDEFSYRHTRA